MSPNRDKDKFFWNEGSKGVDLLGLCFYLWAGLSWRRLLRSGDRCGFKYRSNDVLKLMHALRYFIFILSWEFFLSFKTYDQKGIQCKQAWGSQQWIQTAILITYWHDALFRKCIASSKSFTFLEFDQLVRGTRGTHFIRSHST